MSIKHASSFDMDPQNQGGANALDSSMDASSGYEQPPKKKRIRAKLDHLSPNEKLQRRKMKNRIAAQTARDRKRAKIDYLEEENRKLRVENEALRLQLNQGGSGLVKQPNIVIDSGISDNDSTPKTSASASMADCAETDHLAVPAKSALAPVTASVRPTTNQFPASPDGSSTSGAYSSSPMPEVNEYLDCAVGEIDESLLINDILQLQESLFSDQSKTTPLESAELISAPQQQGQGALYQPQSVENSAGWTSIQLMLLLIISRIHRIYSWRINCCAMIHEHTSCDKSSSCNNLYDYILTSRCVDYRRAAEAVISNKNNVRQQKLVALEFVYRYLYNRRLYPTEVCLNPPNTSINMKA